MSPVAGVMTIPDYMSPAQIVEHVQRLESLGYKYVWMPDIFGREIYVTAGFILANTTRIGVASAIAHVYGRDYIASAQAARTLSEFSGGRFIQGLGVSNPLASQIRGIPLENPVQKIREYVTAIRDYTPMNTPFNGPPVKIFVAAHGPKMLAVAAEVADGANTYMQTPEHTAQARKILGPDKALNVLLPCCLSTDPIAAREAGRRAISIYLPLPAYQNQWASQGFTQADWSDNGSDRLVDTYVAWGNLETILARMQEHIDAGATEIEIAAASATPEIAGSEWELLEAVAPNRL